MSSWMNKEQQESLSKFYKKKHQEQLQQVNHFTEMQEQWERLQERKQEPGFPYSNAYDPGDYTTELKDAQKWLARLIEDHAEYLL